jgi:3'-phosphoadenosine 5'-phosphosulfate synthase
MKGFVVWLTGLSGAGKSTLAVALAGELDRRGRTVEVLDGDEVRTHLSKGLGFSREDRDTNVRRIGYVARLVARSGGVAITAAISPYREVRDEIRAQTPNFVEVYVRCSIPELTRRDVKGLYERALRGEIANFTGVSDPYEAPERPEVVVDSETQTEAESLAAILDALTRLGLVDGAPPNTLLEGEALQVADARARALPRIDVGVRVVADAYMLATGALRPLTGFTGEADYLSVIETGRLTSGEPFPIPVTLRVAEPAIRAGEVALWHGGRPVAVVDVRDVYAADARREVVSVFGTADEAHPGVRAVLGAGRRALAGSVVALGRPGSSFGAYHLTPGEVRAIRDERGWRTMVGFQTRNPVHRAHEYLQKVALELIDGLLLHPLVGETKGDDIPAGVRMRCYEELLRGYYPAERTLLAVNPAWMRYAGPKEAVFHAIVRRNYGCTHFIVGRDHAGVGNYYDTYAAHRIFEEYTPAELGIEILRFEHTFWCQECGGMASTRTCPHPPESHLALSGTRVRELLASGSALPEEFTRPAVARVLAQPQESVA